MGIIFKSTFVPIRLFITVSIPLTLVYGTALLVYGPAKSLKWTGWSSLSDPAGTGIFWITPVMTICVLVGLALDYDVFLYDRIYEYRLNGWDDTSSIVLGVYQTGTIITAAGCIMTIAFATLMFSNIPCMNQFGFILTFAVLIDTFIIRTALVPAILSMAGPLNWWPGGVPRATIFLEESEREWTSTHPTADNLKHLPVDPGLGKNYQAMGDNSLRSSYAMDAEDSKLKNIKVPDRTGYPRRDSPSDTLSWQRGSQVHFSNKVENIQI